MSDERVLLLVAVNTDQPNIKRRMETILAASAPWENVSNAEVFAKTIDELEPFDIEGLARLVGWDAVERLMIEQGCPAGGEHVLDRFQPRDGSTVPDECEKCGQPRPKPEPREP